MDTFACQVGTAFNLTATLAGSDGSAIGSYDATTPLQAVLWPGGNQAATVAVAATWANVTLGEVALVVPAPATAGLPIGRYQGELLILDPARGPLAVYRWQVDFTTASMLTVAPPCYATLADLQVYGRSWLAELQTVQDEAGFARQCGRARSWLDDWILRRVPAGTTGSFVGPGWGIGPSLYGGQGPSLYFRSLLDQNLLVVRDWVVEATAKRALALICEGQIGPNDSGAQYRQLARTYLTDAQAVAGSNVAEIATAPGQAVYHRINLGAGSLGGWSY